MLLLVVKMRKLFATPVTIILLLNKMLTDMSLIAVLFLEALGANSAQEKVFVPMFFLVALGTV